MHKRPKLAQIVDNMKDMLDCPKAVPVNKIGFAASPFRPDVCIMDILAPAIKEEAGVTAMNTDTRTEAQQAKDYLISCLDETVRRKEKEAYHAFGMDGVAVRNIAELKAAFKDGWFKLDEKSLKHFDDEDRVWNVWDFVKVENPERPRDDKGYEEARKEIRKEASDVKDQIVVFGPEKGLEALNAFKAKTFH